MVVGYVRLSKDDNKRDYISIENQKLILTQYAKEKGFYIERWYEDDGFSGYTFDRPGFRQMRMDLLEGRISIVLAKDLSRIGRHNARVLLFLEEIREMGKRVILTDDGYDSAKEEEDTLGIKTWYNERYVKDTSKKIKRAMRARQKEGTLAVNPPFGYLRNSLNKTVIEIDEEAAPIIQRIYSLYLEGLGFRQIASLLDKEGLPTPSLLMQQRQLLQGKDYGKKVAYHWSPKMVGDIIKNDIYIGHMRYHKMERIAIHGKEYRVREQEQYHFENHHPAIIDQNTYHLAQMILAKRINTSYRGQVGKSKYTGFLWCDTCKRKLTGIKRKGKEKYYICSTYNSKGKTFCSQSATIREEELDKILRYYRDYYLKKYSNRLHAMLEDRMKEERNKKISIRDLQEKEYEKVEGEVKVLLQRQVVFPTNNMEGKLLLDEISQKVLEEKLMKLQNLKKQLERDKTNEFTFNTNDGNSEFAWLAEEIMKNQDNMPVHRQEIEAMIEKIILHTEGNITIEVKDNIDIF